MLIVSDGCCGRLASSATLSFSFSSHLIRNYCLRMTRNRLGRMNSPGTKEMFPRLSPELAGHAVAGTSGEVLIIGGICPGGVEHFQMFELWAVGMIGTETWIVRTLQTKACKRYNAQITCFVSLISWLPSITSFRFFCLPPIIPI